jgi:hypothetical protein
MNRFVFALMASMFLFASCERRKGGPSQQTRALIETIEAALKSYESTYAKELDETGNELRNPWLVQVLTTTNVLNPLGMPFIPAGPVRDNTNLLDAWGRPLHVLLFQNEKAAKEAGFPSGPLVIWSEGPNRINQVGHGDDESNGATLGHSPK